MTAPTMDPTVIPRSTVDTWHGRLVDLRTALEETVEKITYDDSQFGGLRVVLDLCVAELKRVNLALEIVVAGWDLQDGNPYAAACRSEGLLP